MELADRGTVRDAMPFSNWPQIEQALRQFLDSRAYAHARGVVHRDLKPENLSLFDADVEAKLDWCVKLADFGIAHAFGEERQVETERLETAAGTPLYVSPDETALEALAERVRESGLGLFAGPIRGE